MSNPKDGTAAVQSTERQDAAPDAAPVHPESARPEAPAPDPAAATAGAEPQPSPEELAAARERRRARAARRAAALAAAQAGAVSPPAPGADAPSQPSPEELAAARERRRARAARAAAASAAAAAATADPAPAPESTPEAAPAEGPAAPAAPAPQPGLARFQLRHWIAAASFVVLVLLPFLATAGYLWFRAADQYNSEVAFSIRAEESGAAAAGLLGALTQINTGTASDADILFDYIRSQKIVEEVGSELDLRAVWNRPGTGWLTGDPVFTLGASPSIEALHGQWNRMVQVAYDAGAGILHVSARAFDPADARAIAAAVLERSDHLVNTLSEQSRADAVRFAEQELAEAEARLRTVRTRLADFRRDNSMVDPSADTAGQAGLMTSLQSELARALVDRDVIASYAKEGDQRLVQADRRIAAITARLEDERSGQRLTGVTGSLPEVVGAYEELSVDLEFANAAYTQALASLTGARAEAGRRSRYLAAHVEPTLAGTALYPRRAMMAGMVGLFLFLGWGVFMLVWYNVRDNN